MTAVGNSSLDLVKQYGDLLERHMFQDVEFASSFSAYPQLWADFILPNRKPGQPTLVVGGWLRLAERNYTAIVRCWNTKIACDRVINICTHIAGDESNGSRFLELQEALVAFFCCAGAAIDNLEHAFDQEPVSSPAIGTKEIDAQPRLRWIYDRRTQSVHRILVPCFEAGGVPSLDVCFFADTEVHWDVAKRIRVESIAEFMEDLWKQFAPQMNSVWYNLYNLLKQKQPPSTQEIAVVSPALYEVRCSSGAPGITFTIYPSGT